MVITSAFWVFLITTLTLLWSAGGWQGRRLAVVCAVAAMLTYFANKGFGFVGGRTLVLMIDSGLLFFALYLAASSDRYWPIWFAAFHSIAVASRLANFLFSAELANLYGNLAGFWAIPALGASAIGVVLDRRTQEAF